MSINRWDVDNWDDGRYWDQVVEEKQQTILSDANIVIEDVQQTILSNANVEKEIGPLALISDTNVVIEDNQQIILSDAEVKVEDNQQTILSDVNVVIEDNQQTILSDALIEGRGQGGINSKRQKYFIGPRVDGPYDDITIDSGYIHPTDGKKN